MMYRDLFKQLSEKLPALDDMPANWLPTFDFIHATAENCYGWHIEVILKISANVSYCRKCGYDMISGQSEEDTIEWYYMSRGLKPTLHRHAWSHKDVALYHRIIHYDNELDAVNEEISNLVKEKGNIL